MTAQSFDWPSNTVFLVWAASHNARDRRKQLSASYGTMAGRVSQPKYDFENNFVFQQST